MARLTGEIREIVKLNGEEVVLTLRMPTSEELCDFLSERYERQGGQKMRDNSYSARTKLFDRLLTKVENLEDSQGVAITPERKELIPASWKHVIIFKNFEEVAVNIK